MNQKQYSCNKEIKGKELPLDRKRLVSIGVMGLILIGIIAMGCLSTVAGTNPGVLSSRPDPETGIVNWMSAVNEKNIQRLYELSPDFIKRNVTEREFIDSNAGNPILEPGFKFTNYEIMNKTVEGNNANIKAVLLSNSSLSINATGGIPIFYNFIFSYENNEWKVWTIQF